MAATPAFLNRIFVGAPTNGTYHFRTQDNDGVSAFQNNTITEGWYTPDTFRTAFLTLLQSDIATARMGLSSQGYWTIDKTGGAPNFRIEFGDVWMARYLGLEGTTTLSGAQSYVIARRMRGALHPAVPVASFRQEPRGEGSQERSNAGVIATTVFGDEVLESPGMTIRHLDNVTEYVTPGSSVGTSYAATGITDYIHARDYWWRLEDGVFVNQGWRDGRYFMYFADAANAAIAIGSALGFTYTGSQYSLWTPVGSNMHDWAKVASPVVDHLILFDLSIPVSAYVSPT